MNATLQNLTLKSELVAKELTKGNIPSLFAGKGSQVEKIRVFSDRYAREGFSAP